MTKKRSAIKLQQRTQQTQTYVAAATASLFLLIGGFFLSVYVLDWDIGVSQPAGSGSSQQQLSSQSNGAWGSASVWNKGL